MDQALSRFPSLSNSERSVPRSAKHSTYSTLSASSANNSLRRFPSLYSTRAPTTTTGTSVLGDITESEAGCSSSERYTSFRAHGVSLYLDLPLAHADSIRILRVKAGLPNSLLECVLAVTTPEASKNRYAALSYTWDREGPVTPIRVNGRITGVRRNLFDLIYSLRELHRDVLIWADAICIDQDSHSERNHQVQLMSRIYSCAACTQLWLGNDLPMLAKQMWNTRRAAGDHNDHVSPMCDPSSSAEQILLTLLQHRYWTRAWIIQEVLLAREVYVHCGNQALCWADTIQMARNLLKASHLPGHRHLQAFGESTLMHLHSMRKSRRPRGLPDLLKDYANAGCQDIRDRVFSLIGLVTDRNDPLFSEGSSTDVSVNRKNIIDYNLPLQSLFIRLVGMYPALPAKSFALHLWKAFELDCHHLDSAQLRERVEVCVFPCSLLNLSSLQTRSLASTEPDLQLASREEFFCFSDPGSPIDARSSRVVLSVHATPSDYRSEAMLSTHACSVETGRLTLRRPSYDVLCQAFDGTMVHKSMNAWVAKVPLASLKTLHAITYPAAKSSQSLFRAVNEETLGNYDIEPDMQEWVTAISTPLTSVPSHMHSKSDLHTFQHSITHSTIALQASALHEQPQPVMQAPDDVLPRYKRRHRVFRRLRLTRMYVWFTRPVYGDRAPAWSVSSTRR